MDYVFVLLCTFVVYSYGQANTKDNTNEEHVGCKVSKGDNEEVDGTLHFQLGNKYKQWQLAEDRAKTITRMRGRTKVLVRHKRGWSPKTLWGEDQDEEEEENTREINRCQLSCWAGWNHWGKCTTNCGNGGVRMRIRQVLPNKHCRCPGVSTQTQACNRACNNGGRPNSRDSCSCPAGFTGQCCENSITCGYLGVPHHGIATPYGHSHSYNTVVRYSCNTGYTIVGSVTARRCDEDGRWTGSTPVCQRVRCGNIGAPQYGSVTGSSILEYESIVQFSCEVGFFMEGSETSICQADGSWSHPVPTCNKGGCGDPGPVNHGLVIGTEHSFGSSVRYECNEGYVLVGSAERQCQADGRWSCEQPRCLTADSLLKKCPLLEDIDNGQVVTTQGYLYQSIAEYICMEGFYLDGHEHRACQVNEEWSGNKPNCRAILCEPLTAPVHGEVSQPDGLVPFGALATFSCLRGHVLEGYHERVCGGNGPVGIWSGVQPSCQAISCGAPTVPSNGRVVGYSYKLDDNVTVECGPGFYLQGSQQLTCNRESTWIGNTDDNPLCIECPLNEYSSEISSSDSCTACPENSETSETGSSDSRQCKCMEGFKRETDDGPCEEITCPFPPVAPGTVVMNTCELNYSRSCLFDCDYGYIRFVGHFYRTCSGTGQWTGEPLQCAPCPQNTYKLDSVSCATCPSNSRTLGLNSSETDCIPLDGFELRIDGNILDIDECLSETTNPCAVRELCVNTAGGAYCDCPGGTITVPNPDGSRALQSCITEENRCESITKPVNGGLECNVTGEDEICRVYCDMDYEMMMHDTYYVTCGPSSGYAWSNTTLPECVSTVFGTPSMNGIVSYPEVDCAELTQNKKQDAINAFVDMAENEGVCSKSKGSLCEVIRAEAVCTEEPPAVLRFDRKKRSVQDTENSNWISFNFTFKLDPYFHKDTYGCDELLCREKYLTLLQFSSWKTAESLRHLIDNCDLCIVSDDGSVQRALLDLDQDLRVSCPPGAVPKRHHCVCLPGLKYNQETNVCEDSDLVNGHAEEESQGSGEERSFSESLGSGEETPRLQPTTDCAYEPNPCTEENLRGGRIMFSHKDGNRYYVECNPSNVGQCRVTECAEGYVFNSEQGVCIWQI